jgi:hypothetical protein
MKKPEFTSSHAAFIGKNGAKVKVPSAARRLNFQDSQHSIEKVPLNLSIHKQSLEEVESQASELDKNPFEIKQPRLQKHSSHRNFAKKNLLS